MKRTIPILIALLSWAATARAQDPATSFAELPTRLGAGDTILVTNDAGETIKGKVERVVDTMLVLRSRQQTLQLTAADVQRIERPRVSIGKNALVGATVGFAAGAVLASTDDCSKPNFVGCFRNPKGVILVGGTFGLLGLGVGAVAGAVLSQREHVVFVRASRGSSQATIAPVLTREGAGLGSRLAFDERRPLVEREASGRYEPPARRIRARRGFSCSRWSVR